MADYFVKEDSLIAVADAIREKTGETAELSFPADFITKINDLANSSSGGESTNPTCEIFIGNSADFDAYVYYYDSAANEIKKVVVSWEKTITVDMNSILVIENSQFASDEVYGHIVNGELLALQTTNSYIVYVKGNGYIQIMLYGDIV